MKALLAIVVLIGILAVAGSIMVGIRSFDGTVADNSYEKGLRWDDIQKQRESLGWHVIINNGTIHTGRNKIDFSIRGREGLMVNDLEIELTASRPSSSEYDTKTAARKTENGRYSAVLDFPLYGYWDLTFAVGTANKKIKLTEKIFIKKEE